MERIEFLVQGSSEDPYRVTFERHGNQIISFCTCLAGENGTYCKHRLSILGGLDTGVVSANLDQVAIVASWLPGSNIDAKLAELAVAERNLQQAKNEVTKAKKKLAATMMGR
jgi:hypothetical protein